MRILLFIIFLSLSINILSQTPYRLKFLAEYDLPRRIQIGVKLLSSKPLAFSVKGGYQLPFLNFGGYNDRTSSITKPWSLSGPVANVGIECGLTQNLNHFLSLEFETASLTGHYQYPYYWNVGKDYDITLSKVQAISNTFLFGYNYHIRNIYNFSVFAKIGGIDRYAIENIYYEGSRMPTATNQLKEPINKSYHKIVFTVRLGAQYCFGYSKMAKAKHRNNFSYIKTYLLQKDSLINSLFKNYQYTGDGIDEYRDIKRKLNHWINRHPFSKDSLLIENKLNYFKQLIEKELLNRTMKEGTYKRILKKGDTEIIKRIHRDYYHYRNSKKYRTLYLQSKLN